MANMICIGLGLLIIYMNKEYHIGLKYIESDITKWGENRKFGMFFLYLIIFLCYSTTVIVELASDLIQYRICRRYRRSKTYNWIVCWKFFRIINFMVVPVFISELSYYFRMNGMSINIVSNSIGAIESGKSMKYPDFIIIYDIVGILIAHCVYLFGKNIFILKSFLKSRISNTSGNQDIDNKKFKKTFIFLSILYLTSVSMFVTLFMLDFFKLIVVFSVEFNTLCFYVLTTVLYSIVFLFIEKYTVNNKVH